MSISRAAVVLLGLACLLAPRPGAAQGNKKPAPPPVSDADKAKLRERAEGLRKQIASAVEKAEHAVDLEVFDKAITWALRYSEFPAENSVKVLGEAITIGEKRVAAFKKGEAKEFAQKTGRYVLAYRSKIDDSIQPYALTLPESYKAKSQERWPLYVVLHGRQDAVNQAVFIRQNEGKPAPKEQTWIQLDVYGRGNNAYRWAGETDVFEAIADVLKRCRIDERRITLWGFSMGGAGAWHLGTHHPDRWASVGAGAGFSDTYRYQKVAEPFASPVDETLRIYDAVGYAMNLSDVPFITYGGEDDAQLLASQIMQEAATQVNAPLKALVGPKMGHKFDDASLKTFMAFLADGNKQGRPAPTERTKLRFATWTVKYNQCGWLTVEEQAVPYERSTVESREDGGVLKVDTLNVTALSVDRGVGNRIQIDDAEEVDLNAAGDGRLPSVYFVKGDKGWEVLDYDDSLSFTDNDQLRKRHDLQGPIDDAFMSRFVCVRGTGTPWSASLQKWADWNLGRLQSEFDQFMRGTVLTADDKTLSEQQIEESHLVLFGDPGSNSVIARVVEKLPIEWTKEKIVVGGKSYDPTRQAVVLIYPNPLNPKRYVVINSGMSMHAKEFRASNAQLFPRLGDIAVIEFHTNAKGDSYEEKTLFADIFNASWQLD
jgi:dienelactone hydrolase